MGKWKIWREICSDAKRATNKDLRIATDHLMNTVILYAIYIVLVIFVLGGDQWAKEIDLKLLAIAAPISCYPIVFIWRVLTVIPDREIAQTERLNVLKRRLTPTLEIEVLNGGKPKRFNTTKGPDERIAIAVRNNSARESDIVSATLLTLSGDNGASLRDAVDFSWQGDSNRDLEWVTIPPRGVKTAKLFLTGQLGVGLPDTGDYADRDFFDGGTIFQGIMSINDRYYGALSVHFELQTVPDIVFRIAKIELPLTETIQNIELDRDRHGHA